MAEKCECKIVMRGQTAHKLGVNPRQYEVIEYCPLHAAAEKLRDALAALPLSPYHASNESDAEFRRRLHSWFANEFRGWCAKVRHEALATARGEKP